MDAGDLTRRRSPIRPPENAEKRGPDVFTVTAGVVGPQAAEQVLVALADAGYVVRADGVPAPDTAATERGHPDMPTFTQGEDCPFLRDWVHFCDLGRRHKGSHHCPCGLEVPRGR